MKRKFFIALAIVAMSVTCAIGLAACDFVGGHSHDMVYHSTVDATCTEDGNIEYWYCDGCGKYFTDAEGNNETAFAQLVISATGHTPADPVRENEVPATCTAEGSYDEVVYCEVCDEEISRTSKNIDKIAHTYSDEWSFDDIYHWHAATCCNTGAVSDEAFHTVEGGVCTVCNAFVGTMWLQYTLSNDGTYYIVSDIGKATDTEIIIPPEVNGLPVTTISDFAFYGCGSLESITIPDSVTSIGDYVFSYCKSLESIVVESGNTVYHSSGNCIIETATKTLVVGCKTSEIPNDGSVTSIGSSAFEECNSLTTITIPNGVTSIGKEAFRGCDSLTSITIGDSVTSIGDYAFYGCDSLE
ncbi:MAG: leucine-rich repeat domain-containing protein, partial [Oscillospiraceae bacterium]